MERTAFILTGEGMNVSPAAGEALLLEEFSCYQALCAGMTLADENTPTENGGVFLRSDADFDPYELKKALSSLRKTNITLVSPDGDEVGYVLDGTYAAELDMTKLAALPQVSVRYCSRITPETIDYILADRRRETREKYQSMGAFLESEDMTLSPLYSIGKGTFLGRGTVLMGIGTIGENCALHGPCRLKDVTLGDNVTVTQSVLYEATVKSRTTVGPFAYLRPGTEVGFGARIGDFVEIKNSVIDDGTKVSHLTYIGDSDVGKGVNFGCGTVTSNYDGLKKYRTVIGDHAFIGCNTNLVAPVKVGDNVYIAAGSTITEDIPDAALAIARSRQTNKENWVTERKPDLLKK